LSHRTFRPLHVVNEKQKLHKIQCILIKFNSFSVNKEECISLCVLTIIHNNYQNLDTNGIFHSHTDKYAVVFVLKTEFFPETLISFGGSRVEFLKEKIQGSITTLSVFGGTTPSLTVKVLRYYHYV
jgi:hypothetical protein